MPATWLACKPDHSSTLFHCLLEEPHTDGGVNTAEGALLACSGEPSRRVEARGAGGADFRHLALRRAAGRGLSIASLAGCFVQVFGRPAKIRSRAGNVRPAFPCKGLGILP
jgi:hypothetical protein